MTPWLLNLLIFFLRFSEDPALAIQILKMPKARMDAATILPLGIKLPKDVLPESSGLAVAGHGRFWSHNDSGGGTDLYEVDSNGNLLQTISISGVKNKDWEDLAQDRAGEVLFIGDFGNNANKRKDLAIYRIENISKPDSLQTSKISFRYPEQKEFPPQKSEMNYDCEAFIYFKDSLYLFTKHQLSGNGVTRRYRVPATPGNYEAELLDSFFVNNVVTAADLSPDNSKLALLTYGTIYIFSDFRNTDFFGGNFLKINIPLAQTEGIAFQDNDKLFYTSEEGKLHKIKLDKLKIKQPVFRDKYCKPDLKLVTNPHNNSLKIKLKEKDFAVYSARLLSVEGETVSGPVDFTGSKTVLSTKQLPAGMYILQLFKNNIVAGKYEIRLR